MDVEPMKGEIIKILSFSVNRGFVSYKVEKYWTFPMKVVREKDFRTAREYNLLLEFKKETTEKEFGGEEKECTIVKIVGHRTHCVNGVRTFAVRWSGWEHPLWNSELEEYELEVGYDSLLQAYKKRHDLH